MSINKIDAPGATPATFWPQTINQLAALVIDKERPPRNSTTHILNGAMFNIGGVMFVADSDTLISGTDSGLIKLTVSGSVASPSYVSSSTGVTWNGTYKGYYDISGNFYFIDEQEMTKIRSKGTELAGYKLSRACTVPYHLMQVTTQTIATIVISTRKKQAAKIIGLSITVTNTVNSDASTVYLKYGSTVLHSWTDVSSYSADIPCDIDITSSDITLTVDYRETGATDNRGPFVITLECRTIPDVAIGDSDKQKINDILTGLDYTVTSTW